MAEAVAAIQNRDGSLPAYVTPQWRPKAGWTCVTGNAQMAINWLRLARAIGASSLIASAKRANRFNMGIQDLDSENPGVRGGIKGSHPINGGYMNWRYPNWAAKFFMDALMLEKFHERIADIG
jgi:hypothetical protein